VEIVKFPHPALLTPCKEVTVFGEELKTILQNMVICMYANRGIGLASNQVGLNYCMFVMTTQEGKILFLVNPKIIQASRNIAFIEEGCLSLPGQRIDTRNRASWVQMQYQNEYGNYHTTIFDSIDSVCVQHELQHLEGKAFFLSKNISKTNRIKLAKLAGVKLK
jgi:peptide deformylase